MFIGQNGENAATEYQKGILNMKHTKYWMPLALCAAMALSLAACGSKAPAQDSTKDTQQTEAEDTVIGGENAQIPNPWTWTEYASIEDAEATVGFDVTLPELPDGYALSYIQALTERGLLEITYENESGDELSIRKAPGDGDISGDYNDYAQSDTITVSDREVTLKGNDDGNVNSKCEKNIKKYNQASRANSSRHSANTISAVFQPNISRG